MNRKYEYFEMLDYTREPVRVFGGKKLYLGTCGEDNEYHGIEEDYGTFAPAFEEHNSIHAVAEKWNRLTGDNAEGFDLAWEPNYSTFDHLKKLAEEIETQHVNRVCNHDGPCEHIVAFAQYLGTHEGDRELFEDYFNTAFPCNMFSKLADIEDHPENWISEENLPDWTENYCPEK